jgi:positive regulator of sigma E activity
MSELIKHDAVIRSIEDDAIKVTILSKAACASCQLKGVCSASDIQEKEIKVKKPLTGFEKYEIGDKVKVIMTESLGLKALFLGYVLPFIILLTTLIVSYTYTRNEPISGLVSLASLAPYYFIIHLLRRKIDKEFTFEIEFLSVQVGGFP